MRSVNNLDLVTEESFGAKGDMKSSLESVVRRDLTRPFEFGGYEFPPVVDLEKFEAIMINGIRGGGKSAKGEKLLEEFWSNGRIALSLTEAPFSFESMYAAIPRGGNDPIPVIYITPKDVRIEAPDELDIISLEEDVPVRKVLKLAKEEHRMVIFCASLWGPQRELQAYGRLAKWINDMCMIQRSLRTDMAVLIREVEMQAYSRLKSDRSSKALKSALIDLLRLARSSYRMSVIADLQLAQDMDRAMRGQLDKWLICAQDPEDMPEAMRWLPRAIERRRLALRGNPIRDRLFPSLSYLYPHEAYYVIRRKKHFCKLEFDLPGHRHRREKDDLSDFGIFVREGGELKASSELRDFREKWYKYSTRDLTKKQKLELAGEALALKKHRGTPWTVLAKMIGIPWQTLYRWGQVVIELNEQEK